MSSALSHIFAMHLHVAILLAISYLGHVLTAPLSEDDNIKLGMRSAFERGLSVFGGRVNKGPRLSMTPSSTANSQVSSQNTEEAVALGGGRPSIIAQYNRHRYIPPVSRSVPKHFNVPEYQILPIRQYYVEKPKIDVVYQSNPTVNNSLTLPQVSSKAESPIPLPQVSSNIVALGGGKPTLSDQYRNHHYVPQATSFIPKAPIFPQITPNAPQIYAPSPPLQYTVQRLRIP